MRAELGDRERAARLLGGNGGDGPPSLLNAVTLAQLQLADGETDAARATLAPWAESFEHSPEAVQARVIDALARAAAADHEERELARTRARAGRASRPAAVAGAVRPLAAAAAARQLRRGTGHRALIGDLLDEIDGTNGRTRAKAPLVVERLSPREPVVLRYLPTMMSNQEIASELFVSVNTVKTHLKSIYRKLDVTDRRDAVRRARELELLGP